MLFIIPFVNQLVGIPAASKTGLLGLPRLFGTKYEKRMTSVTHRVRIDLVLLRANLTHIKRSSPMVHHGCQVDSNPGQYQKAATSKALLVIAGSGAEEQEYTKPT